MDGIVHFYENVDRGEVRLVLLQAADRIMPEIDPILADYGNRVLAARRGVDVRTNTRVRAIEPRKVHLAEETIAADTIVLAAGVVPNSVVAGLPVEKDKRGCVMVDPTMRCPGHAEVWALGDCASIPSPNGKPYPSLGQHALREAQCAGRQHLPGAEQPTAEAVRLRYAWNDGLFGSQHGVRSFSQTPDPWLPGLVHSPHLLPAADARLESATTHDD